MPNCANGKIYIVSFHNSNEVYIGSTVTSTAFYISARKACHRRQKTSLNQLINDKYNSGLVICYYELYENYGCSNNSELLKREGEIIMLFKNDSNYNCIIQIH